MTMDQWIEILQTVSLLFILLALIFIQAKLLRMGRMLEVVFTTAAVNDQTAKRLYVPPCRCYRRRRKQPSADYYMTLTGKLIDLRTAAERHASEPDQAHQLPGCEPPTEAVRSQRPHE